MAENYRIIVPWVEIARLRSQEWCFEADMEEKFLSLTSTVLCRSEQLHGWKPCDLVKSSRTSDEDFLSDIVHLDNMRKEDRKTGEMLCGTSWVIKGSFHRFSTWSSVMMAQRCHQTTRLSVCYKPEFKLVAVYTIQVHYGRCKIQCFCTKIQICI